MAQHRLGDSQLKESLRREGQLLPVLRCRGRVYDGARRVRWLRRLGREIVYRDFRTLESLAPALWHLEPDRALAMFRAERTLDECCTLFRCTRAELSPINRRRPAPSRRRYRFAVDRVSRLLELVEEGGAELTIAAIREALECR